MSYNVNKENTKRELIRLFAMADSWFDRGELLHFSPAGNDLSPMKIMDQTVTTNGFILRAMEHGVSANTSAANGFKVHPATTDALDDPPPEDFLKLSFREGHYSVCECRIERAAVWSKLRWQLYKCLMLLDTAERKPNIYFDDHRYMSDGADLIRLIILNMKYGLSQMEKIEGEYESEVIG